MNTPDEPTIIKILAAGLGSLVSLRFLTGTFVERALMTVGGAALSFFATDPVAGYLKAHDADGLVGFLLGLFGMAVLAKAYEVVQLLDAKAVAQQLMDTIKRKWGA